MAAISPFSLEDVFHFDATYIDELLTSNHYPIRSPLINKLSATILLHNGAYLRTEDNEYVANKSFSTLYLYDDDILIQIARILQLDHNVDRIKLIHIIIDNLNTYDQGQKGELLIDYAKKGHTETVRILLENRANVHASHFYFYDYGYPLQEKEDASLQEAVRNGYTEIVKLLLEYDANVHVDDLNRVKDIPLRQAAFEGYTEIVQLLLEYKPDVHANNDYSLRQAARKGYTEIVRLLLENDANVHADNDYSLRLVGELRSQPLRSPKGDRLGSRKWSYRNSQIIIGK